MRARALASALPLLLLVLSLGTALDGAAVHETLPLVEGAAGALGDAAARAALANLAQLQAAAQQDLALAHALAQAAQQGLDGRAVQPTLAMLAVVTAELAPFQAFAADPLGPGTDEALVHAMAARLALLRGALEAAALELAFALTNAAGDALVHAADGSVRVATELAGLLTDVSAAQLALFAGDARAFCALAAALTVRAWALAGAALATLPPQLGPLAPAVPASAAQAARAAVLQVAAAVGPLLNPNPMLGGGSLLAPLDIAAIVEAAAFAVAGLALALLAEKACAAGQLAAALLTP
jgi:hypothetical protein